MELLIGRVVKSHGIKGEVAVEVTTDSPEERYVVGEVLHGKQGKKEHELTIATLEHIRGVCSLASRKSLTAPQRTRYAEPSSLRNPSRIRTTTASMTTSWRGCAYYWTARTLGK